MQRSGSSLPLIAICLLVGCTSLPTTSRTGQVHEVVISDTLSPRNIEVHPGDEVKWVNRGFAPVWMYFENDLPDELSCERGFAYYFATEEVAKIEAGQSASLCFGHPENVGYTVQWQPTVHGGARLSDQVVPEGILGAVVVVAPAGSR